MEASTSCSSSAPNFCSSILPLKKRMATRTGRRRQQMQMDYFIKTRTIISAARRSGEHDQFSSAGNNGRLVDENLIVLRKRIHETKMMERNYEPPANWMEWEKKYYTSYDSIIFEAMGQLQSKLMDSRPSHVLAMAILIALSVPTSATLLLLRLVTGS